MHRSRNLREEIERSARELLEQIQDMRLFSKEDRNRLPAFSLQTMEVEESLRQFLKRVDQLRSQPTEVGELPSKPYLLKRGDQPRSRDEQARYGQRSEV